MAKCVEQQAFSLMGPSVFDSKTVKSHNSGLGAGSSVG